MANANSHQEPHGNFRYKVASIPVLLDHSDVRSGSVKADGLWSALNEVFRMHTEAEGIPPSIIRIYGSGRELLYISEEVRATEVGENLVGQAANPKALIRIV